MSILRSIQKTATISVFFALFTAPSIAQRFVDLTSTCGGNLPCYTTIQAAVTAAASGELITVYPGIYVESVLIGSKSLTLVSTAGRTSTIIQGVENGVGSLVIDGTTTNFSLGTNAANGFTVVGIANPSNNASEVGAVVVKDGPHVNLSIVGNDIRAAGDDGFLHYYGTTITGFSFDQNVLSGQTYTGPQPEQTCCSGSCYFSASYSNVARSLFSLNGSASGPVVTDLKFTNNNIIGSTGAGSNGNVVVQMTVGTALIERNTFSGQTVSMGASCNRGMLRIRGNDVTIDCNQFNGSRLSGAGAYYMQFDQNDAYNGGAMQVNTLAGVAAYNTYDANPVAYFSPLGASCPAYQRSVFVNTTAASAYSACGGSLQTVTGACQRPLPVTLVSFTAQLSAAQQVDLAWITANEQNNKYFLVERSVDLKQIDLLNQVYALEGSDGQSRSYRLTDEIPYVGTSYYRLRQVDLDGTITAYPWVSVALRPDGYGVFPNPIVNQQFTLRLDEPQTAVVRLYDLAGHELSLQKVSHGTTNLLLKISKSLSTGLYILKVEERGQSRQYRLVID